MSSMVINDQQFQHDLLGDTFLKWNNLEMTSPRRFSRDFEGLVTELQDLILKNKISNTLPQWVFEATSIPGVPLEEAALLWTHVIWFQSTN
ncbi:hypothetical protein H2248_011026 [Termitomyces sp. 'cryptogamus']|nr:hypothetical protein H2248_011026 [Termitomyces sp. 'cryptogamus']